MGTDLTEYAEFLGDHDDAALAEITGATVEEVAAFRASKVVTHPDAPAGAIGTAAWAAPGHQGESLGLEVDDDGKVLDPFSENLLEAAHKLLEQGYTLEGTTLVPPAGLRQRSKTGPVIELKEVVRFKAPNSKGKMITHEHHKSIYRGETAEIIMQRADANGQVGAYEILSQ